MLLHNHESERRLPQLELAPALDEVPRAGGEPLVIGEDCSFFRAPHGGVVDLRRYEKLRLVLDRLRRERLENPGGGVALHALLQSGWPGERVLPKAGASRVYVALSTLRRLGLRDLLLSRRGSYLLDPAVRVELGEPLPPEAAPEPRPLDAGQL